MNEVLFKQIERENTALKYKVDWLRKRIDRAIQIGKQDIGMTDFGKVCYMIGELEYAKEKILDGGEV